MTTIGFKISTNNDKIMMIKSALKVLIKHYDDSEDNDGYPAQVTQKDMAYNLLTKIRAEWDPVLKKKTTYYSWLRLDDTQASMFNFSLKLLIEFCDEQINQGRSEYEVTKNLAHGLQSDIQTGQCWNLTSTNNFVNSAGYADLAKKK